MANTAGRSAPTKTPEEIIHMQTEIGTTALIATMPEGDYTPNPRHRAAHLPEAMIHDTTQFDSFWVEKRHPREPPHVTPHCRQHDFAAAAADAAVASSSDDDDDEEERSDEFVQPSFSAHVPIMPMTKMIAITVKQPPLPFASFSAINMSSTRV